MTWNYEISQMYVILHMLYAFVYKFLYNRPMMIQKETKKM